jgi:hypothetical protein
MKANEAKFEVASTMLTELLASVRDASDFKATTQRDCDRVVRQIRRQAQRLCDDVCDTGGDIGVPYLWFKDHKGNTTRYSIYE